jgi:hypothetical protein
MTRLFSALFFCGAAAIFGGSGCSVTDTGNPATPGGGPLGGPWCDEVESEIDFDEQTSLGFSAADVAPLVSGRHTETLAWLDGANAASGEGTTEIEVDVVLDETARYVKRNPGDESDGLVGDGPAGSSNCNDRVALGATLTLTTADGKLDEVVETTIYADSATLASTTFTLPADELMGDLEVTPSVPSGFEVDGPPELQFDIQFAAVGWIGHVGALVKYKDHVSASGGAPAYGGSAIAQWPAENPCPLAFPVPTDQSEDLQALLDAFNGRGPLNVTYEPDGEPAALDYELGSDAEYVCQSLPDGSLDFVGQLELSSDDGLIDGRFPLDVSVEPDDSGAVTHVYALMMEYGDDPAALLESFGIGQSVDFTGYDQWQVRLEAQLADDTLSGALSVRGVGVADCTMAPPDDGSSGMGAPGCSGANYTDLWVASFGE